MIRWERQQDGNWLGLSGELLVATVAKQAAEKEQWLWDHNCAEASQGLAQGSWTPILLDRRTPSCRGILGEVARGGGAPPGRDATGITERCHGAHAIGRERSFRGIRSYFESGRQKVKCAGRGSDSCTTR